MTRSRPRRGRRRELLDAGAEDKRLLMHEDELAHVLAVAAREGSTLSSLSAPPGTAAGSRTATRAQAARH